jgi:hypothetical protein
MFTKGGVLLVIADRGLQESILTERHPRLRTIEITGVRKPMAKTKAAQLNACMDKPLDLARLVATANDLLAAARSEFFRERLPPTSRRGAVRFGVRP